MSSLKPPSRSLGISADASLIFHSAKISARTGGDQLFFALSAYSFKTAVTDQKDAYTILCLEDGAMNSHSAIAAAGKTNASRDMKAAQRYGKEYILWELTYG